MNGVVFWNLISGSNLGLDFFPRPQVAAYNSVACAVCDSRSDHLESSGVALLHTLLIHWRSGHLDTWSFFLLKCLLLHKHVKLMDSGPHAPAASLICLQHTKELNHIMRLSFNFERKTSATPPPGRWAVCPLTSVLMVHIHFPWTMMSLERTIRIVIGTITDLISVLSFAEDLTATVHSIFLLSLEIPGGGWPRLFRAAR